MKKFGVIFSLIVIYFVIYFLQVNFFSWFNIDGIQPNLFVLLALFIGIFINGKMGAISGFIIGLYTDFLFSNSIGISAVILALVGFCGYILEKRFSRDSKITIVLMGLISTGIYEIIVIAFRAITMGATISFIPFIYKIFVELLYNSLLIIILYPLIHRFGIYAEEIFNSKKMLTRYF